MSFDMSFKGFSVRWFTKANRGNSRSFGSLRFVSEHFLSAIAEMSLRRDSNGRGQINAIKNVVAILIRFVVDREQ